MTRAVIFDMDGVLVDSEPFHVTIEKRQFTLNNLVITEEEHHQYMGVASDVMWHSIAKRHHLPLEVEMLIAQNLEESIRFFNELEEIPVMPGLVEVLEELTRRGYPMAVASSSFHEIIALILARTGLHKYFQHIVSSQEAGKSKPEPDVFLLAARKLDIAPEACLVVEDSYNGIKAAKAAGMRCIAYQGPGADPARQTQADVVIRYYSQLLTLL